MASLIGLLISFIKIFEAFLDINARRDEERQTRHAILSLQNYRERLERSLLARRQSRAEHSGDDISVDGNDSLPDDGYRRD
ncbi:MAG: hypothetical protein ABJL18_00220 [Hyphomicrobiales bacterium]